MDLALAYILGAATAVALLKVVVPRIEAYQADKAKKAAVRARIDKAMATRRAKAEPARMD